VTVYVNPKAGIVTSGTLAVAKAQFVAAMAGLGEAAGNAIVPGAPATRGKCRTPGVPWLLLGLNSIV
jgi:hypothetical protein